MSLAILSKASRTLIKRTTLRASLVCAALIFSALAGTAYAGCTSGPIVLCTGNNGNKHDGIDLGDNVQLTIGGGYVAGKDTGLVIGNNSTITLNDAGSGSTFAAIGGENGTAISWGSNNTLNLSNGAALIGGGSSPYPPGKVTGGSNNTINLQGSSNNGLDVGTITGGGFAHFNMEAATGTIWQLQGTGNNTQNWNIISGILAGDTNSIQGSSITNNSTLAFSQTFNGTYGGNITGSGLVAVDCTGKSPCATNGTVSFSAANGYTGETGIANGTLALIGNGSIANSSSVQVAAGAGFDISGANGGRTIKDLIGATGSFLTLGNNTLTFGTNNGIASFGGNISGNGGLIKQGTGTAVLGGTNNYSGGTTVNGGILGGNTGSLQGPIGLASGTILAFSQTADGTYNNVISGGGEVASLASGFTLTLTGNNTYTGETAVKAGTLAIGAGGSITDSSSLQLASGATFDISGGGAQTITDLFGASGSAINLGGNKLTFGTNTAQTAFAGNISGAGGALDKKGTGTVILTGTNTYTGGTTVEAGTLGGNSSSLQGNIIADSGTTIGFSQTANGTYSGVMSGAGQLASIGAGFTLTLTGHNTYTGDTLVGAGTLAIGAGGSIATSDALKLASGAGFDISHGGNQTVTDLIGAAGSTIKLGSNQLTFGTATASAVFAGDISGSGSLFKQGSGTAILAGTNTYTGGTTVSTGTLGGNSLSLQGNILVDNAATLAFSQSQNGTYAGVISGPGVVANIGAGFTLTFTGDNTYTGATGIAAGTLAIGAGGSISDSSGVNLDSGAGFDISKGGSQLIKDLNGAAGSTINLGANTLTFGTGDQNTFAGDIFGTGALVKQNAGTMILAGTNTYSGGTTVLAGTLGGNTQSLQGNILNDSTVAFSQTTNGTYSGVLSGTGVLVTGGAGFTLTLTGDNTYTGTTAIGAGTLALGAGGSIADSTAVSLAAGAGFDISGGGNQTINDLIGAVGSTVNLGANVLTFGTSTPKAVFAGDISGSGGLIKQGSGTVILGGTNTYSGGTTVLSGILGGNTQSLQGNIANQATVAFSQTANGTYAGVMSGTGVLISNSPGFTLTLSGNNTYTGATVIQAGTLAMAVGGSIASSSGVALAAPGATFDISNGGAQTIKDLNGGPGTAVTLGTSELTLGTANTSTFAGIISGVGGGIDKIGSGVLVLLGANTYSGGTIIEAGTLAGNTTSLQGDFLNDATLVFDQTTQGTFAGTIGGTGTMVVEGGGELILSNSQSYTGPTLVEGNTTLVLGSRSSIADSKGLTLTASGATFDILGDETIQDLAGASGTKINLLSGTLTEGTANSTTFAGNIRGSGGLVKQGSGTLSLLGINTYSGGTTVTGGTLLGTSLSLQGDILNNAALVFNQAFAGTYSGVLSGSGSLLLEGGGTLTLSSAETYTGPTQVNASTLVLGPGSTIASSSGLNLATPGAVFDMSNAGNQTLQDLSGAAGSLVNLGANTLTEGTANSTTFNGVITGAGALTKEGGGTLTLGAVNSYGGLTTIDNGTVAIGPGGSIAASAGVNLTTPNSVFDISKAGPETIQDLFGVAGSLINLGANTLTEGTATSTTFSGNLVGGGALVKQGSGTLTLLGANTYTGGTLVSAGKLTGNTTSLQGNITNNAALEFSQTFAGTYSGVLSGSGSLTFLGTGSYTLTNNSAGYTGPTLVNGTSLVIGPDAFPGGVLGGPITVANGGTVSGHGADNGNLTNPNGNVSPGGSVGTLTVTGSFVQASAGNLTIELDPTGASKLAVAGAANIAGTLTVAPTQSSNLRGLYPILTSGGGITGIFNDFINEASALPMVVQYLPNVVNLAVGGFEGQTPNEAAVANTLNKSFTNASGDFINVLAAAVALTNAQVPQTLSSLGGQIYANLAEVSLQDRRMFLGAMDERIGAFSVGGGPSGAMMGGLGGAFAGGWGSSGNAAQFAALGNAVADAQFGTPSGGGDGTAAGSPHNFWARGYGQFGNLESSSQTLGSSYSTGGGAVGMDLLATPQSLIGIAAAGGRSSVSLSTNPETAAITFVSVGAYAAQTLAYGTVLDGAVIYSHDFYNVTRGIVLPGLTPGRVATSNHNGNDAVVDVGFSRPWLVNEWWITPRVGLSYFHISQSPFNETGANSIDLSVTPNDLDALRSRIGFAVSRPLQLGNTTVLPEFKLAWTHDLADDHGSFNAAFAGASTIPFQQVGAVTGRDAAELGAGVSFGIGQNALPGRLSGFVRYDGTASAHNVAHAATAGLRWQW
jgi:fibronectin-binding autotransporter adhesin